MPVADPDPEPWTPPLSLKQQEIFNAGTMEDAGAVHPDAPTALLVSGGRKSGKTIGVCHRVIRHLWEVKGARVALVSKTIRSMTDGGIWQDLLEVALPIWFESGIGIEFTTTDPQGMPGPKTHYTPKTLLFRVRNMHGGESELKLISLEHDQEVKAKLKQSRWSLIWFSELSLFKSADVFRTSIMQLRMVHLKPWQMLWIADTNPSEEGVSSWIYKQWYLKQPTKENEIFCKSLRLIEVHLDDNPFIADGEKEYQRSLYKDDPGEFDREVDGKWTRGHGNKGKHFADVFIERAHVVGGGEGETDQINVSKNTDTLYVGWDLGTVNHSAVILEKNIVQINNQEWTVWNVLDCLLYLGEQKTVSEFTLDFMLKMQEVQDINKRKMHFYHWADDSALNVYKGTAAGYDYLEVKAASNDAINLNGVQAPSGSVRMRVKLLRRLLRENRLWVSSRCTAVIEMLKECREGTTAKEYVDNDLHKHTFDALTYPIYMESAYELQMHGSYRPDADVTHASVRL